MIQAHLLADQMEETLRQNMVICWNHSKLISHEALGSLQRMTLPMLPEASVPNIENEKPTVIEGSSQHEEHYPNSEKDVVLDDKTGSQQSVDTGISVQVDKASALGQAVEMSPHHEASAISLVKRKSTRGKAVVGGSQTDSTRGTASGELGVSSRSMASGQQAMATASSNVTVVQGQVRERISLIEQAIESLFNQKQELEDHLDKEIKVIERKLKPLFEEKKKLEDKL